jgi:type III secretory pathway component EscV
MKKEDALALLDSIENSLRRLHIEIRRVKTSNIYKKAVKDSSQKIGTKWFEELGPSLPSLGVTDELRQKYHDLFTTLLLLSVKTSVKQTYLKTIDAILQDFKEELFVTIMKSAGQVVSVSHIAKILENATDEEKDYLDEALGCASRGFFRASVVLGWSAAVHRMHKTVEKLGFDEFNKKCEEMKKAGGRFKRWNKSFPVHSLSDLRTVFDNDLLWVLEYWQLIDSNQHDRLSICFTMRSNSAHPGEAPITEENLASFYSDLKAFVFDNPKFKL